METRFLRFAARTLVVTILAGTVPVAAYEPVPGGEFLNRLRSPLFLAGTENTAATESVAGDAINPASSALKQRIHLDASYAALVGDGAWNGHAANAGTAVPTPVGVFSGSLSVLHANYSGVDLGTRGSLNLGFAKDLYPSLLFGAGLQGHIGSRDGAMDLAGGLDLGIVHILGPRGPLPEVRWGLALTQIGVGLNPGSGITGSPSPFTLSGDIQATIVRSDVLEWSAHAGLSLPSFQNLRLRAGTGLSFRDVVSLTVGWDTDLRNPDSALPSVGLSASFTTGGDQDSADARPWTRSDVTVRGGWAPLTDDVWAAGAGANVAFGVIDRNPPEVELDYEETVYVSPNNDGAADDFLLPIAISDERYVDSWTLEITDQDGNTVRTIENKEQRPENEGFRNIIDRLLYVKQGVDVPEQVRWDGRTDDGGVAPDGTYRFSVTAVDDNGNTRRTEPREIVVDATAPEPIVTVPDDPDALIFSPNDDGSKDTVTIVQESSPEDEWTLEVRDARDEVVYAETVTGTLASFTWDGRNNEGTLVADGVYTYRVSATDRAQNTAEATVNNIIVDTEPTPIGLAADIGAFSPNDDGRRDAVQLTPDVPVLEGIRAFTYRVTDAAGTVVRSETTRDAAPTSWMFDGRDDAGARLPEGRYTATLELVYRNGNRPTAESPTLLLDVTPPRLAVTTDTPIFSPNGDGRIDTVRFFHETEDVPSWEAVIRDTAGSPVRRYRWSGRPDPELVWQGRTESGERVPDGRYRYVLTGEDRAGNRRSSTPIAIELDTRETPVFISTSRSAFSPNADGSADGLDLIPALEDPAGVERFSMELLDSSGEVVARISDSGVPAERYEWDGRGADGRVVADGSYAVRLTVEYRHGNRPQAVSAPFVVDTVAPEVAVELAAAIFSPDGDGNQDEIEIRQRSSSESRWTAAIVPAGRDEAVREWEFSGALAPIAWDGTGDDGEIVTDGRYRYRVESTDEAGNRTVVTTDPFRIDTRAVDASIRLAAAAFSPNGDDTLDTVEIRPTVTIDTPISEWTITVEDADGTARRRYSGTGELAPIVWDGRTDGGTTAPDGSYRARLAVQFARGDAVDVNSPRPVELDTVAPDASFTFSSDVISPNGDGNLEELVITQRTSEEPRWTAVILDESDREVGRWEWIGRAPEQVAFTGLNTARQRVSDGVYRYRLSATDAAGNSTTVGPEPFEIYTAETPVEIYPSVAAISPNGDGTFDAVTFPVITGDAEGFQRYEFSIRTADGAVVREESGDRRPTEIRWDGTDDSGRRVDEGRYTAEIALYYRHGNEPTATAPPVTVDVTPPALDLSVNYEIFSPDGDGRRDAISIRQESDEETTWTAAIRDAAGATVRRWEWNGALPSLGWDGTDPAGNVVDDGTYRYTVSGTDAAGNTAAGEIPAIRVDTRPTRVFLTLDRRTISPNGDGQDDVLRIRTITRRQDGAEYETIEILAADGTVVSAVRSEEVAAATTREWDGTGDDGSLPDGEYSVRYRVAYDNGALAETVSPLVLLDTTGPALQANLDGLPFSPDNDGLNDELRIALDVRDASGIDEWRFEILDRNRRPFQQFSGNGRPRDVLRWDGRSNTGELVISAEDYPYRFVAVDETGNESAIEGVIPIDILVIRDGDLLKVQISNINFAPNSPELELDRSTDAGRSNIQVLDRLVEVFDKYRSYEIRVEGHAVNISGTEREQEEELIPLSRARADTVRRALIERGMDADRISIVGRGGADPIVPHTDRENRWKNRRVEFILIR